MKVLVNVDVPDLEAAERFYHEGLGLHTGRRLEKGFVELLGAETPIYLLKAREGSPGAGSDPRRYTRHWTPVHMDFVVDDIEAAVAQAVKAGAVLEHPPKLHPYGWLAVLADPFGHGLCFIQFVGRGYDELLG